MKTFSTARYTSKAKRLTGRKAKSLPGVIYTGSGEKAGPIVPLDAPFTFICRVFSRFCRAVLLCSMQVYIHHYNLLPEVIQHLRYRYEEAQLKMVLLRIASPILPGRKPGGDLHKSTGVTPARTC